MADEQQTNAEAEVKTGAEGESQGGFNEAFAERATGPQSEAEAKPADPAAAEAAASKEPASTTDAAAQAPSQEAADAGGDQSQDDPYSGLTPKQQEHFKRLEQSERSNRGRVGALTKQLNSRIGGTPKPPEENAGEQRERSDEGGEGKPAATDIEARLKATTDEYGDIVGPVAELVQELRQEIAGLKASETRKQVDQDAETLTEAYVKLEAKHPDYRDIPAKPEFGEWFGKQTPGIQALLNSLDPDEVSLGLQLFKTETAAKPSADDTTDKGKGDNGGTATGDRRERQLDALAQPTNRGAPASSGVPNDFGSAFSARSAQHRK